MEQQGGKQIRVSPFAAFLGLVLLVCLLLYSQVFFLGFGLYYRDIYHNYYPFVDFITRSLHQGDFPFWNPYLFTGMPQLAALEPPLFYPLAWMFFSGLTYSKALALNLILHHLIAAAGVYLLGRSFGWRWFTCTLCACLFSFSGIMVSMNNFHPLQNTVAWLPLVFWAAHELLTKPRRLPLLVFAAAYSLQILSAHLEIVYFESLLLLGYGLLLLPSLPRPRRRPLLLLGAGGVLGVAMSAIQLLPAIWYLPDSVRKAGLGSEITQLWSFHPALTLMLLLPEQSGNLFEDATLNTIFGEKTFGYGQFFLSSYLGLLTWLLFLSGLTLLPRLKARSRFLFFSLVFVLCLLLAYGKFTPLYQGLLVLPGASFFRYPAKLLIFADFGLVLAAGCVLEQLLGEPKLARRLSLVAAVLASLALLLWLALRLNPEPGYRLLQGLLQIWRADLNPELARKWVEYFARFFSQQLLVFALLLLLFGGLWLLYSRRAQRPALLLATLLAAVNLELLASGINTVWTVDPRLFEGPSEISAYLQRLKLDQHPQERLMVANDHVSVPTSFARDKLALVHFRPNIYQHEAMVNNYSLVHDFHNLYGFSPSNSYASNHLYVLYQQALAAGQEQFRLAYETLGSARYLLTVDPPPAVEALFRDSSAYRLLQYFPELNVTIWENLHWLPRARFQYQALTVANRELMVTAMSQPKATGFDLSRQVLLLDDQRLAEAKAQVPASEAKIKHWSEPRFLDEGNNRVEIGFETNTSGYLVLADQNLPGWQAWDNGRPVPILPANYLQRAIRVGPGKHRIVFRYEPPGWRAGAILSGVALCLWLGLLLRRKVPVAAVMADAPGA
ncbi:MAG: YfhO family protein [Candidatus Sericytochromatia bacterium]